MSTDASTRDRLVEAARTLFHEKGYEATAVADILKKAGVRSGSLYYFFHSKEDLLEAVLDRYLELLWPEVMEPAFARAQDPIERIFYVLEGYRQHLLSTDFRRGCPIGNLALELGDQHGRARSKITANLDAWCAAIRKCLDAAERLPEHVDRGELARFILTVMEGAVMQARAYRSLASFDASISQLRAYVRMLLAAGHARGAATTTSGDAHPPLT